MSDPAAHANMEWPSLGYPKPDYISSRKWIARQLMGKGGILRGWDKKMAIAVDHPFFEQLLPLPEVEPSKADLAWLIYELVYDAAKNRYSLAPFRTVYTRFEEVFGGDIEPRSGDEKEFLSQFGM